MWRNKQSSIKNLRNKYIYFFTDFHLNINITGKRKIEKKLVEIGYGWKESIENENGT